MLFVGCLVVIFMLRASTLGLDLLPSGFHSCQRVYRFGTRWVTTRTPRSASKKTAQLRPLGHIPSKDVEESSPLTGEQAHTKIGSHPACSPVSSMSVKENSSTLPSAKSACELQLSEPGPTKPNKKMIKVYSPLEAVKSRAISQSPSYAAGRPWSPENVKAVNIPKYLLSPLRRLRRETIVACRLYRRYERAQNAGKVTPTSGDLKRAKNAGEDTPSMEPPLQDHKEEQNASKVTPPMKKPPFPDAASQLILHLAIIGSTNSVNEGWNSYVFLVDFISGSVDVQRHIRHIPLAHLHRLARLLAKNRPPTRRQFLKLLAVLTYINYWGGMLKQFEWNALVAHAGSGWRTTKLENVRNAMKVFKDMRAGRLPGSSDFLPPDREFLEGPPVEPDIYTYTSLLAIASRTIRANHVHNISSMLSKAGLPPNRITHLSLMRYFSLRADFNGIRLTLLKMRQQGLELGLDGLNSCLWAYGRNRRLDLVMMIYRILRHNMLPETEQKEIDQIIGRLGEENIFVEPEIRPNEVTLTTVIQVMAYHGHFSSTLDIFMDMLSFKNMEKGAPVKETSAGVYEPTTYQPSLAVFRAIFLGFSRHAQPIKHLSEWNIENLSDILDLFLELPSNSTPNHNTIYFIMLAFDKASGRDIKILRDVWMRIDRRFGIVLHKAHSVSRLARLQRLLFSEEDEIRYHHRFRHST